MTGLTQKQRVKVNAALSMIYDQGYDAQTVVGWAREHERNGRDARSAYQLALNEFVGGQPGLAGPMGKVTRLIDASDANTVAQYDQALSAYIATGDDAPLAALAPMIARDSVALAVKNGELAAGDVNAANVEAATGFSMADEYIAAASQPDAVAPTAPPREVAFKHNNQPTEVGMADKPDNRPTDTHSSQYSPFSGGGRVANKAAWNPAFDGNRMNANANTGSLGPSRTVLQGHVIGPVAQGIAKL